MKKNVHVQAKDGLVPALTDLEWAAVRAIRMKNFFKSNTDPYTWTFKHRDHFHFVFYKNGEIVGYLHLQLSSDRAAMRIIVIEEKYRHLGYGSELLRLCEEWLKEQGYKKLVVQSSPEAYLFYQKHGYMEMPFDDPDGYKTDPRDIEIGKVLSR